MSTSVDTSPLRLLVILVGGVVAALIFAWVYVTYFEDSSGTPAESASTGATVLYEVEGRALDGASITYVTPDGISQEADARVPLRPPGLSGDRGLLVGPFPSGSVVSISAQNNGDTGNLVCRISIGNTVLSENRSDGGFTIVSCDAVVP